MRFPYSQSLAVPRIETNDGLSLRTRLKVKNTGGIFKGCCKVHEGHKRPKRYLPTLQTPRIPRSKLRVQRTGSLD
eukprot:654317-Prorocentrum_minimum.AAC.1